MLFLFHLEKLTLIHQRFVSNDLVSIFHEFCKTPAAMRDVLANDKQIHGYFIFIITRKNLLIHTESFDAGTIKSHLVNVGLVALPALLHLLSLAPYFQELFFESVPRKSSEVVRHKINRSSAAFSDQHNTGMLV